MVPAHAAAQSESGDDAEPNQSRMSSERPGDTADESSGEPAGEESPESDSADSPDSAQTPTEYCDEFLESYARSSARKLYRALNGQGFELEKVQLQDWIDVDVRTPSGEVETVEFGVYREKGGRAAGLADSEREYQRTLIVASTGVGPVVVSQKWPAFDELGSRSECRPISSRIEYPQVATDSIDIKPFKFWGLRVIWRLPKAFAEGDHDRENLYETMVEVMSSEEDDDE